MIKATELLRAVHDFDPSAFILHKREEALISKGFKTTAQGWFDQRGQFLGKTAEAAVRFKAIRYDQVKPTDFYIVTEEESNNDLLPNQGVVLLFRGVWVYGEVIDG